jgi:hypothetical protein
MRKGLLCVVAFLASGLMHASLLSTTELANGVRLAVDAPAISPGTIVSVRIVLSAPEGQLLTRAVLLVGYNEAAGNYVPSQPPSCTAQLEGSDQSVPLNAALSPSWALWPVIGFSRSMTNATAGEVLQEAVSTDPFAMLPQKAVPFERPDEHDWITLAYADNPPHGAKALLFSVPVVFSKADASLYLWVAAATKAGSAGIYLPASVASSAPVQEAPPTTTAQLIVTQPRNGDVVGASVDVVGSAQPGALVVIWTEVYKRQTGELVRSVPGIRHKTEPDGSFHVRIATPRVFLGEDVPLVYKLHVRADYGGNQSKPVVIEIHPQR